MLIMPYGTESKSRNADFILIAQGAIPPPSAPQALSPPATHTPPPPPPPPPPPGGRPPVNLHTENVSKSKKQK